VCSARHPQGQAAYPSADRKEERRNARVARANTFEAIAKELIDKFEAGGDASTTLKKRRWLLDFANKERIPAANPV